MPEPSDDAKRMVDEGKKVARELASGLIHRVPLSEGGDWRDLVPAPIRIVIEPGRGRGLDEQFRQWLRNGIENMGGNPDILQRKAAEPPRWVLVQGYHDSGTIDSVIGPYTEEHADWLLSGLLASSYSNWTKVKLSSGPKEEPPDGS